MAEASLKEIIEFFGMRMAEFRKEWNELTETDKQQIKEGIGNGSLNY